MYLCSGTRHSSATELRSNYRKDEIKDHGTGHATRIIDLYVQDDLEAQCERSKIARYSTPDSARQLPVNQEIKE